ncbi:two-component sensor histidine kinase [Streptomyces sp. 8K308]|uniref:sensor histidine kinase n=1 Tax=Streptomyces sp. 8K308 TaxID=2530388 RepID=UPI0010472B8A|nr:histidine kinase [Streptomyces sp. 8K308]TDC10605.1 two-component sensor histidine kinase [Streptomyces sp. 8K308]
MRRATEWPWWVEAMVVAVVATVSVSDASVAAGGGRAAIPSMTVSFAASVALPLRHRWPLPVAAAAVVVAGGWGMILPLLLVTFHLTSHGRVRLALSTGGVALGLNVLVQPSLNLWTPRTYGPCSLFIVALALGLWAGSSRRLADALARQVEHLHRERELRESAARISERTAIAAEMHDVLAHRLSLIALHSGVLSTRAEQLPGPVADRIQLLRTASTDALADLRDVLGALHTRDDERDRPLAPPLREVDELIDEAREAGQEIEARIDGRADQAPAAHRLAVYRLVQEAVTNARKHAPRASVRVLVRYGGAATRAEVTNTAPAGGTAAAAVPSGYGLVGLRERVRALGGALDAGPVGGGAWRVAADIPVQPPATAGEHPSLDRPLATAWATETGHERNGGRA